MNWDELTNQQMVQVERLHRDIYNINVALDSFEEDKGLGVFCLSNEEKLKKLLKKKEKELAKF